MCPEIVQLPPEIIHGILSNVSPEDLAAVSRTCRRFYHSVVDNSPLWRSVYLRTLDCPSTGDVSWENDLHDYVKLMRICHSRSAGKKTELPFVFRTVGRLLETAARSGGAGTGGQGRDAAEKRVSHTVTRVFSRNSALLGALLAHQSNRDAFLCRSFIFQRARGFATQYMDPPCEEHQQSAKLHCLYGQMSLTFGRTRSSHIFPFALSRVYDLRQYTAETMWGPFRDDGSGHVDWERVEAILIVLKHNVEKKGLNAYPIIANTWSSPFPGSWAHSYVPMPLERELGPLELEDPYDVSGTWLRMVCFLDYDDFLTYNTEEAYLPDTLPRPAREMEEATRLILMKIHVTKIEPPGNNDGQDLPVVYFEGFSRSLDGSMDENANSDLRGTCRLTPEGEVRWTTFSIFHGEERWRSEGVQVGGPRSARGVVGNWFDRDYDPNGPCGPTAFWKISDRRPNGDDDRILYSDFLPLVDLDEADETDYEDYDIEDFESYIPELDLFAEVYSD